MLKKNYVYYLSICLGLSCIGCRGAKTDSSSNVWNRISAYFSPPPAYQNNYASYRSPLLFYNGDTVKTTNDWQKRRTEIKEKWMDIMGQWPPVITSQQLVILNTLHREGFTQHRVRFYWTPNEETEAYLLVPTIRGKKPAVITVFYEPETAIGAGELPNRDFAYQLTRRGFVTLSIGTTRTTQDKTYSLYYPNISHATIQPLSALAYAAANAWEVLAKVEEVDSARIGIAGHSYGGKWAMFASCLYDKFACAAWSDPGIVFDETKEGYINYWEPWYLGYYPPPWTNTWNKNNTNQQGAYPKLRKDGHDLHELHALMAPRPFLVSGGFSDGPQRWTALNHTIAVNRLLGYENRVAMTNRAEHSPNLQSNEAIYDFFECFLGSTGK